MNSPGLIAIAFLAGLGVGWFGKIFVESNQLSFGTVKTNATGANQSTVTHSDTVSDAVSTDSQLATRSELAPSSQANPENRRSLGNDPQQGVQRLAQDNNDTSLLDTFDKLLKDRRYFDAITLFQEQKAQSEQIAVQLRISLLDELKSLIENRNNSDFSELVENYLSIFYDDIDVLLLLAEFNQTNGSYLEVVNVFLLAKTYAYSDVDQEKVARRFNDFVMKVDSSYTDQKNYLSLINLYTHINTSGLMTSTYQYSQALAYLRSGDKAFAVEQLNQLVNDTQVGESAAKVLSSLSSDSETPTIIYESAWEGADSIALQKFGNQYAVNLGNNRQDSVKLLIDTGASMTAVSRNSFNTLNASGDAVVQDRRVFRTANGLVQATVYSVPELSLGPHRLENTNIAVIEFDNHRGIDGLLGMNILGQFRFQIDQDKSLLVLSSK